MFPRPALCSPLARALPGRRLVSYRGISVARTIRACALRSGRPVVSARRRTSSTRDGRLAGVTRGSRHAMTRTVKAQGQVLGEDTCLLRVMRIQVRRQPDEELRHPALPDAVFLHPLDVGQQLLDGSCTRGAVHEGQQLSLRMVPIIGWYPGDGGQGSDRALGQRCTRLAHRQAHQCPAADTGIRTGVHGIDQVVAAAETEEAREEAINNVGC